MLAGIGVALSGLAAAPASPVTRALPAVALALPAEASFVAGIDVKRLAASSFYQKQVAARNLARPDAFRQLEEETGLNPERDVDQIFVAGSKGRRGVAIVLGQFDAFKLSRAAEARPGVKAEKVGGVTLYSFAPQGALGPGGLAFLDKGTLLSGDAGAVRSALEAHARGQSPLRGNAPLFALTERVKAGATFWMVGDGSLLGSLSAGSMGGAAGSSLSLPNLKSLIVTGDLEPQVVLSIVGDAADDASAKSLADTARGFVSLFALQSAAKPELKELASAFSVTQKANQVLLDFHVSPETLTALVPKPAPKPIAPKAQ